MLLGMRGGGRENPERKMVSSGFQCSFKTESSVNVRRKAGGGGEEAQPLLAPDEIGGLAGHVGAA